jgi:integrase/recombinase XerD
MQYIEQFLLARELEELAKGTLYQYELELKKLPKFLNKPTIEATTNDLRKYLLQFKGMAIRTMSRKIATLKAFYSWLVDEELIDKSPMRKIKTPKEPKNLPEIINRKQFETLRYTKKSPRNRAIFELLASSGMRVGELVSLNIKNLDMENRKIKIIGKGSKERIVYFSHIAKFCLIEYLNTRKDNNPALFLNKYGNRLGIRSIEMQIKAEAIKAGIDVKVTPHKYRHYFSGTLYTNDCPLEVISELLGHSSMNTTLKIYAHINDAKIASMYDKYSIN